MSKPAIEPCSHVVQLYGEDAHALRSRVARYLGDGLARGDAALVVATAAHCDAFICQLAADGHEPIEAIRSGRLALMDAAVILPQLMVEGRPDWIAFEQTMGGAVRSLRALTGASRIRAYGELVGVLWQSGQLDSAAVLEGFWNRLLHEGTFSLFCGYPVDLLDPALDLDALHPILAAHTRVVADDAMLQPALAAAVAAVTGDLRQRAHVAELEPAAAVRWIRDHLPHHAPEILSRARHYQTSELKAG